MDLARTWSTSARWRVRSRSASNPPSARSGREIARRDGDGKLYLVLGAGPLEKRRVAMSVLAEPFAFTDEIEAADSRRRKSILRKTHR